MLNNNRYALFVKIIHINRRNEKLQNIRHSQLVSQF